MTPAPDIPVQRQHVLLGRHKLSFLAAGPLHGERVMLLHGMPASAELWRGVLPALARAGYRTLAPDLPGYGNTQMAEGADYSLAGAAALLLEWLARDHPEPIWLIGHDLGGGVAQIIAARSPRLLAALTLCDAPVADSWPVLPIQLFRVIARLGLYPMAAAARLVPNPYAWLELRRSLADPSRLTAELARRIFWDTKVTNPAGRQAFARHLCALDNRQTVEIAAALAHVPIPVQILWGDTDRFQPWERVGQRLAAHLPDPKISLLQNAGHFLMLDQPEAFSAALLAWRPPPARRQEQTAD